MTIEQDLHKQADKEKSDLNAGVAAVVPRGDEAHPLKIDPMAARKAMFKKADALREREQANGDGADPAVVAALEAEARGESPGSPIASAASTTPPAADAGQAPAKYVSIPVEGGEIKVSQVDIDREGSVELYLRRRQLDEAAAQDKIEIARLQRDLAESNRLREESQRARPAGQDDPANRSTSPVDRNPNGSGASEQELAVLAERLATQIYSGDQNDAKAAILEILQRDRGNTLSAEDIERQVRNAVAKTAPTTTATTTVVPSNPRLEAINAQINAMAAQEYADVCGNEIARNATFAYFKQLVNLPENRDRRAVDVARDACDWGRSKFIGDPRSKIVEQKRGLPSSTTASGATQTTPGEEAPLTPAQVVEMQRNHRNFGRRIQP